MRRRCYDPTSCSYSLYGCKGIKVCNEWNNAFLPFKEWAYDNGYKERLTLDRIDSTKDYTPDNCRWASWSDQKINQPVNRRNTSGYTGVFWHKRDQRWCAYVHYKGKRKYLGYHYNAEEAVKARNNFIIKHNLTYKIQ